MINVSILVSCRGMSDDIGMYPEQRLWCAVILEALKEYEEYLQRISIVARTTKQPVDSTYRRGLAAIRRECAHKNFEFICELAQIPFKQVQTRFDRLDKEYCLSSIQFDQIEPQPMPEPQRRYVN